MVGMYASEPSSGLLTDVFPAEPELYGLTPGYNFL